MSAQPVPAARSRIDVRRVVSKIQFAHHAQPLRGEGFVEFDDIHLFECQSGNQP